MTFQPLLPLSGYGGWAFLNRTLDSQKEAFNSTAEVTREVSYFKENIGKIESAEDLVADRALLKVALEAFGLGGDIDSKFFIKKVLDDGTLTDDALANKLSDKRYLELSQAFGFGDFSVPRTKLSTIGDEITAAYQERQFEEAVGDQSQNMRLALGLNRDLSDIAGKDQQEDTKWFTIMGNPPLRKVFETAFNLPASFGALDLDRQLQTFKDKAQQAFGDTGVGQFASDEAQEDLIKLFLLRSEAQAFNISTNGSQTALTLLQSAGRGGLF